MRRSVALAGALIGTRTRATCSIRVPHSLTQIATVRTCRTIVALLREHGVNFEHFDILEDEEVRQGLKRFSNWPTYPQVRSGARARFAQIAIAICECV